MILKDYDYIGTAVPWQMIISLRNRHYLKYWVELGAGYGHQSAIATEHFERIWCVEIDPNVHGSQVAELKHANNATRLLGQTVRHIPEILQGIASKPALWYIDSHNPGSGQKFDVECPLIGELQMIANAGRLDTDCLVIDNAGMFITPPPPPHDPSEWPSIQEILDTLGRIEIIGDVIYRCPRQVYESLRVK